LDLTHTRDHVIAAVTVDGVAPVIDAGIAAVQRGGEAVLDQIGGDQGRDAHTGGRGEKIATIHACLLQDLEGDLQHRGKVAQPPRARHALAGLPAGDVLARYGRVIGDLAQRGSEPGL
jgi:hypothetical protein